MTLRMALLLVSLILIGLIGLLCHFKYRQLNPKKRLKDSALASEADALLDDDINAPFINENIISDIPQTTESVLQTTDSQMRDVAQAPELKTSLSELVDKKKIAQAIAAELLPAYNTNDNSDDTIDEFIFDHVAILPNVKKPAAEIQAFYDKQPARIKNNIVFSASLKKQNQFLPLENIKPKKNITHLKSEFRLKQKSGMADEAVIKEYEGCINSLSNQLDCEYQFALTTEQAIAACENVNVFVKEHDLIIILYILAKPEDSFGGADLQKAVMQAGLKYGEFKFFHFVSELDENNNQKIFSLANMYKPGSFNLDAMEKFSTMGLCAFMVPALINDPLIGFKQMCTHCNQITDALSGVLTTNKRELLNEENYKHICNRIIEQKSRLNDRGVENGSKLANQLFS